MFLVSYNDYCTFIQAFLEDRLMSIKSLEYVCPIIILFIIFTLKLIVDEHLCFENFKRLTVEITVDIMSLSTSFIISFLITSMAKYVSNEVTENILEWNFIKGVISLLIYILLLIIIITCSKYNIRKYSETEKSSYLFIGIAIGYTISVPCLYYSIILLCSLGGI